MFPLIGQTMMMMTETSFHRPLSPIESDGVRFDPFQVLVIGMSSEDCHPYKHSRRRLLLLRFLR